jgi:hypothetical protein
VETLNSMNEKNKGKKAAEYAGELLIITASDVVFKKFMNACQLYENGGLINPDTGRLYRDDDGGPFLGRRVVPYTFKKPSRIRTASSGRTRRQDHGWPKGKWGTAGHR